MSSESTDSGVKLRDRTAIVTGGSSGIGRAIAIEFARNGADVMIGDVREDPKKDDENKTTTEIVQDLGQEALYQRVDVSNEDEVIEFVETATNRFNGIDILVNAAGIGTTNPVDKESIEDWKRVLGVNLNGVFFCSKYTLPYLKESSLGRIIHISSQHGLVGAADAAAYCASKGAVSNLTRQMAIDYGPYGITVNAICPGPIKTGMLDELIESEEDLQRFLDSVVTPFLGEPEDIAHTATFLASDRARFVTGHNLVVDGGYLVK